MPIKRKVSRRVYDTARPQTLYEGEIPEAGKMTATRTWNSAVGSPSTDNDGADTAGLGQVFFVGDRWNDTVNDRLYKCEDNAEGAASWTLYSSGDDGLLGSKEVDETDLSNGSFPWYDSTTGKFEYGVRWEDLRFPFTQSKLGSSLKPDFDQTNVGLLFPESVSTEVAYMNAQMQHSYKIGSDIYPHIHWVQVSSDFPTWKMDYRWYEVGGDPTVAFTTVQVTTGIITYTSGSIHQISSFPAITGSAISLVSSMLDIKIYRDDGNVTGDVLGKEFDIHYQIDTIGSETAAAK
jgi:hypothetical protein